MYTTDTRHFNIRSRRWAGYRRNRKMTLRIDRLQRFREYLNNLAAMHQTDVMIREQSQDASALIALVNENDRPGRCDGRLASGDYRVGPIDLLGRESPIALNMTRCRQPCLRKCLWYDNETFMGRV